MWQKMAKNSLSSTHPQLLVEARPSGRMRLTFVCRDVSNVNHTCAFVVILGPRFTGMLVVAVVVDAIRFTAAAQHGVGSRPLLANLMALSKY